jgi:small nuclear ribonucleoprotein (snRNP)-like protein
MRLKRHPGLNRQVLVSLFSGNAVSGVLVATPGPLMILRGCMVHDADASAPSPADGEIVIEKANVDYIQIVGG